MRPSIQIVQEIDAPYLHSAVEVRIITQYVNMRVNVYLPDHLEGHPYFDHSECVELSDGLKKTISKRAEQYLEQQYSRKPKNR